MKKVHIIFTLLLLAVLPITALADADITSTATASGNTILITGQLSEATEPQSVTVLGGNIDDISNIYSDDIIFIGQQDTDSDGNFSFELPLPDNLPLGTYKYYIGSKTLPSPYQGTFDYTTPSGNEIINVNINIDIVNFVPTISGTIRCNDGKVISLNITNVTNSTIIANETIPSDGRNHAISYSLPNLLIARDYTINLTCAGESGEVLNMNFDISSSTFLISAEGTVSTTDNVRIVGNVQSTSLGGINKNLDFSGEKTVSFTIPNVAANMSFEITATGYETVINSPSVSLQGTQTSYTYTGVSGENIHVPLIVSNIPSFEDLTFELVYNADELVLDNATVQLFNPNDSSNNIEIIEKEQGFVRFKVINTPISSNKYFSGVINLVSFHFDSDFSGVTQIEFKIV